MSGPKGCRLPALLLLLAIARPGLAAESTYEDAPPDGPIDERERPIEKQVEKEPPKKPGPFTGPIQRAVKDWSPVFAESRLDVRFRSYYLYGKRPDNSRREAWTHGGWVRWLSGPLLDRLRFGVGYYTSQRIHAPTDRTGTLLLRPRQGQISVFGEAYAVLKLSEGHESRFYRQIYDLPYLNKHDDRMVPNTFEGYSVQGKFPASGWRPGFTYVAGWVTRIKSRASDRFLPISEQAGAGESKRGLAMAGALFELTPDIHVGVINHHVRDVLNLFYTTADWTRRLSDDWAVKAEVHYTDQRSTGDDLLTGSSFDTHFLAGRIGASYRGATLTLAMTTTSSEREIISPWGSRPSPVNRMLENFDRAGEDAWDVELIYNFKEQGIPGLTVFGSYTRGSDSRDSDTRQSLPDRYEFDLTGDYRLQKGPLRGLWLRVRGAFGNERDGGDSQNELRIILNYDWPVLGPTKSGRRFTR
jgi:hypothetical protein